MINFAVNGVRFYGITATWHRVVKRVESDGTVVYMPYYDHTWQMALAHMAEYQFLQSLRGRLVTLVSSNVDDLNNEKTYNNAELFAVETDQQGRNPTSINLTFKAKV